MACMRFFVTITLIVKQFSLVTSLVAKSSDVIREYTFISDSLNISIQEHRVKTTIKLLLLVQPETGLANT